MPATRPDRLYDCCVAPLDVNESGLGRPTRFGPENASVKGYVGGGAMTSDTLDVFEKPTYTKAGAVHETVVTARTVMVEAIPLQIGARNWPLSFGNFAGGRFWFEGCCLGGL